MEVYTTCSCVYIFDHLADNEQYLTSIERKAEAHTRWCGTAGDASAPPETESVDEEGFTQVTRTAYKTRSTQKQSKHQSSMHLHFLTKDFGVIESRLKEHFTIWASCTGDSRGLMTIGFLTALPEVKLDDEYYQNVLRIHQPSINHKGQLWRNGFDVKEDKNGWKSVTFTPPNDPSTRGSDKSRPSEQR